MEKKYLHSEKYQARLTFLYSTNKKMTCNTSSTYRDYTLKPLYIE